MEPPAAPPYADSLDSSPRSRNAEAWEVDPLPRLRLMCTYGGHIVPRPHDKSLCYLGGDTKLVVVDRNLSLSDLSAILAKRLLNGRSFTLKYQLPSEDLDSLISVTTDEDLDNMIDEFERKPAARIRLFLFPTRPESSQSMMEPIMDLIPSKSEDWFLNALNCGFLDSASVDCLLGFDGGGMAANNSEARGGGGDVVAAADGKSGNKAAADVHMALDFATMENSSSFGSASSSPSLANLPPIRVHVDDVSNRAAAQDQKAAAGIEEQFAQMTVGMTGQQKVDDVSGFSMMSSPPPLPTSLMHAPAAVSSSSAQPDYMNRVVSDIDERSDPGGYRKAIPPQQPQPKSAGMFDLPSPDSVSSDHSFSNVALSRPKPVIYSEPVAQIAPATPTRFPGNLVDPKVNLLDANARVQMQQQVQDSAYVLQNQYGQQLQQLLHQQVQQQQFIHPGAHYVQHHPGSVPVPTYYPYPSQQHLPQQQQQQLHRHPQLDQQQQQYHQVYYMPARPSPQYNNMHMQQPLQSNMSEAAAAAATITSSPSQAPPNPMLSPTAAYSQVRNAPIARPEVATGVYRTAATTATAAPSLIQVPTSQHQPQQQYVSYAQVHPSQATVPNSTGAANYAYEYADASHAQHAQVYYTQPLTHAAMTSQYQTMTAATAMGLPEVSSQLPTDSIKQQQQQRSQ